MAQQPAQGQLGGQPVVVLSEDSQRASGEDAQSMNITAGRAIAESVRTTLGPKGMDKMLVDPIGKIIVTNDGVSLLREMDIEHPAANMIVEVAETQEDEVGDGTTTAVVLAGELLQRAEDLLDQDIHATTLAQGYRQAATRATGVLEEIATVVDTDDEELLHQIAATAMTGKGTENDKDQLAELVVDAVQAIADEEGFDTDNIKVENRIGGSIEDSELIDGLIVDTERFHDDMPRAVEDATVAIVDQDIAVEETAIDTGINVTDPEKLQAFRDREKAGVREKVRKLVDVGADAVIVGMNVDDTGANVFAEEGLFAVRRVSTDDTFRLARATGANVVTNVDDITEDDLGYAGTITENELKDDRTLVVRDTARAKSVTLFLRGGTYHVIDEVERAVRDSLGVVEATLREGKVLPGGGGPEIELALDLRDFADSVGGREQLAIEAFADALEIIPRTLAENAGHDPIDSLVDLRSQHNAGTLGAGLDAYTGDVIDMEAEGVVEPLRVKIQAVESAMEASAMILRIDDVIAAGDSSDSEAGGGPDGAPGGPPRSPGGPGGAPGGPGGMGGMGGAM